jgi:hypothetical protein
MIRTDFHTQVQVFLLAASFSVVVALGSFMLMTFCNRARVRYICVKWQVIVDLSMVRVYVYSIPAYLM